MTIAHGNVPNTDQTNFPVLISGTYSYLATTSNGGNVTSASGYDIIFASDVAGLNVLPFEQESFNPSTGAVNYWVQVPTLSHTTDTVIYMFYGNATITTDQSNKTGVWDSNYRGVWHLPNGSTLTANDSTSGGHNGSLQGSTTPSAVAGKIDGAASFNGSTAYIDVPGSSSLEPSSAITISGWVNYTGTADTNGKIYARPYRSDSSWNSPWISTTLVANLSNTGKPDMDLSMGGTIHSLTANSTINDGNWHYVVGTYDGSYMRLYVDGQPGASPMAETGNIDYSGSTAADVTLGVGSKYVNVGDFVSGNLDEIRVSSVARPADWIATEYNNQNSPSTFYTIGIPNPLTIVTLSQWSGSVGTSISIGGFGFGSSQGTSSITFNGTTASPTSWSNSSIVVPVPAGATPGDVVVTVSGVASNGAFFMVPTSWSNGYSLRRAITINHASVPNTDQTSFPVLISGIYPYLATTTNGGYVTSSNGYDIVFTSDAAGANVLPYERESYNASTGAVIFWVNLPTVSHSTTETVFYVFYGNSAVTTDQSNKTAVWDGNFVGVWHLPNGTSLTANDSTSNGNNGTINGPTATTGEIGGGASFGGGSNRITIGTTGSLSAPFTIEEWAKPVDLNYYYGLFGSRSPSDHGFDETLSGTGVHGDIGNGSSWINTSLDATYPYSANHWYHFAFTISSSGYVIYANGSQIGSGTLSSTGILYDSNHTLAIGSTGSSSGINGAIDETRVSKVVRSADWIATEYNNESNPTGFYTVWSATSLSGGNGANPTISSLSPTSGIIGTTVTLTGTNFNAQQDSSTVTFNNTAATPKSWNDSQIVVPVPTGSQTGNVVVTAGGVASNGVNFTVAPKISSVSPPGAMQGSTVTISGAGFGASQGSSTVTFNGTTATCSSWSDTSIVVQVPSGATTGNLVVTVSGLTSSVVFAVLPANWLDLDIGTVGFIGSATYSSGIYSITGSGNGFNGTADSLHFVYQPLSGDGTIIARLLSTQNTSALMIRESLAAGATEASLMYNNNGYNAYYFSMAYRTTTGGNFSYQGSNYVGLPYWEKLTRVGSTFTAYVSQNAVDWTQIGSTTISMASNVYIGLAAANGSSSSVTATFDSVSISSATQIPPAIVSMPTTGSVGAEITISGANFGTAAGTVVLNDSPLPVNSWSTSSITITIPAGAASGLLEVLAAPTMNASNPVHFTVTSQPLPLGWFDLDVGTPGSVGSASYANGAFTINGAGGLGNTSDSFHFVYQPLTGDGTIVARVLNLQNLGVMIRNTVESGSEDAVLSFTPNQFYWGYRTSTGGSGGTQTSFATPTIPYWMKLTRSGDTFTAYWSQDDVNWNQVGSSESISMEDTVYFGLFAVASNMGFDNVSVNSAQNPAPVISGLSATTGSIGTQVTISGSNFGTSQGSSVVLLSGLPMTVNSWSSTSITITISSGAASGLMGVQVGPSQDASNPVYFTVTTQPLPSGWLDSDIGSVGTTGSAGYTSGTFTVSGAGSGIGGSADSFHFAYEALSGDGTIQARLVTLQGGSTGVSAGVMIRETLASGATYAQEADNNNGGGAFYFPFTDRASTGSSSSFQAGPYTTLPYWVKVTRSGNTFTGYVSPDGVYWTQVGTSVTITMASGVYAGLAVTSGFTSGLATASFDNVSATAATPYSTPNISSISPSSGGISTSVTINGTNFGSSQGSSSVQFNGAAATSITSWNNTQIVAVVPNTATTGALTVIVNGIGSNENNVFTFYNPVISSLTPPFGPVGGSITLSGSGFGATPGSSTVQFNGLNAGTTSWTDTSITAIVPGNVASGPVTVTEGGITSNSAQFSLIEGTTVSGLSPSAGPVGSSVVITGTGFGPSQSNSTVNFVGATATAVTSWSDTSITMTVPSGAITGPIYVDVAGHLAVGPTFDVSSTAVLSDSLGNSTTYTSEVIGATWVTVQSQGSGCSTCSMRGNIVNTFDVNANLLTSTDPLGYKTTYTYDSANDTLSQSTPLNGTTNATTTYTYNSLGEALTVTDPLGNVTTNTYDSHGNLLTVTSPKPNSSTAASVTQFGYNSLGELTTITDPLNHLTTMTYTTAGLIATITDAQNNLTTYAYDAKGNRTSITDALNHTTTFTYDAMSRLTQITYPDSTTTSFTYDIRGRRTSVTDQNGKITGYAYDDADRLTSVTDAANHATTYAYDTEDNLSSITDANSNQTAFTYDALGRVTKTTFPSSLAETYQYDADNNLTQKTDRKNQTITYVYDALNRLSKKQYPDSTEVDYTYDLVGKITQVNDPTGTYAFAYDNMGRLIGTTTSYSFLTSRNFTNAYTYDAASNRMGFTDPENGSTTYSYDTLNRLTSLAPPSAFGSGSFGFSYDALSRRTQMTRPNTVTTNYSYDNLSRLTSILHQLSGSTIDGATYTLDNAGNRTAKTDNRTNVTTNYGYDNVYQLLSATQGATTTESYSYDAVGNRTASLGVSSYTTNASNELTATSNASYTYDSNGNTLTKIDSTGTTSYTWDFENRLTSVTLPGSGGTATFKYDPFGRRIEKSSTTATSVFAYDDDNLTEEVNSSGAVVARYSQTENVDEPLAMVRSGATSFYNADGLGSVTSLASATGALAQTYTLDAFGKQTGSSGSLVNPFQYTGRESDSETGLYYYRARYYDPLIGRFLSEDPTGFGDGVDFYRYVRNSPIDNKDPTGFTTYKGFPEDKEVLMRIAVNEALSKLSPTGGCDSSGPPCAGKDSAQIVSIIRNATFVYQATSKYCGQTGPLSFFGLRHTFGIGWHAFNPECCSLASTIVHEVVHGMRHWTDKRPDQVEKDCFGCIAPE